VVTATGSRTPLAPIAAAILGYGVFAQGAFYWDQLSFFAAGLLVCALMMKSGADRDFSPALIGLSMLAAALLASAAVNKWPSEARIPAATLAAAAGALALGRGVIRSGGRRMLIEAIACIGAGVALAGLIGVAFHAFPWGMKAQDIWRNASTLTYSNAAGALYMLALPAPLWLERERRSPVYRAMSFLCVAGLLTSLSRGAAAGVALAAVLAAVSGGLPLLRAAIRPGIGAAVASAGFIPSIVSDHAQPLPALIALAAGAAIAVLPLHPSERRPRPARALAAAAGVALILAGGFIVSPSTNRLVDARIGRRSQDRTRTWRAAYEAGLKRPIFGTGPGTFEVAELVEGRILLTRYAHNELLQAFVETGAVGVAAVLGAGGLFGVWAWRRRPSRADPERVVWAAGFVACAGFFLHGMLDFMWHIPALVAVTFVWLSVATTRPADVGRADNGEPEAL
jgi:O-antigen ligase